MGDVSAGLSDTILRAFNWRIRRVADRLASIGSRLEELAAARSTPPPPYEPVNIPLLEGPAVPPPVDGPVAGPAAEEPVAAPDDSEDLTSAFEWLFLERGGSRSHLDYDTVRTYFQGISPLDRRDLSRWITTAPVEAHLACFLTLGDLFSCPICYCYMQFGICECANGHVICEPCTGRVRRCAVCEDDRGFHRVRSLERAVTSLILPCDNRDRGCNEYVTADAWATHYLYCPFNPPALSAEEYADVDRRYHDADIM